MPSHPTAVSSPSAVVLDDRARARAAAALVACRPTRAETRRAVAGLRLTAVLIGVALAGSWATLVFVADTAVAAVPLIAVLAIAVIASGTRVMHDANHGAFGRPVWLNSALSFTADVLGASSWLWRLQHNRLHHGNTNVVGIDTDIEQMPFARLAPEQPRRPWHRFQHLYMWPLYGFVTLRLLLLDATALFRRHEDGSRRLQPGRRQLAELVAGKALHVTWAIAVPLLFHPWWIVVSIYLVISWTVGLVLGIFFQLAHCNDLVAFAHADAPRRGDHFPIHQLATTADVHTSGWSRPVGWLMGGLDHQVEHHLAPSVPHPAHRAMAARVRRACAEHHLDHHVHRSLRAAIASHARWLRQMGRAGA